MSIDPKLVQQLSNRPRREVQTVKDVVYRLHSTSPWNELISLESAVLPPIPVIKNKHWVLYSLLALPQHTERNVTGYYAPWGFVSWLWPERTVTQVVDLRIERDNNDTQHTESIPNIPAREKVVLSLETQAQRENTLFHALDELLAQPPSTDIDLHPLAQHYSGLLPEALYPYYWTQFPACREWLRPDVPFSDNQMPTSMPPITSDIVTKASPQNSVPQVEEAYPTDLSPHITSWLQRAMALAQSCKAQEVLVRLRALENRLHYPGFRLAFVGEFNRGKSTLINMLLERPFLPVGVVSTTTSITSIVFGEEESMLVRFPDGKHERRPLTESSWADLVAKSDRGKQQTAFPSIRVTLRQNWLRELDAELLDTPGVNDPYGPRSALASEVLSSSDAAVLLIAAHSPMSQTETVFLEQEVIGKHVPLILVVVSMLDRVEPEQRVLVMEDIREKVAVISPLIPVIATQSLHDEKSSEQTLAEIRDQITTLAVQTQRRTWRSRQVAGMIADYMQQLTELGQTALAIAHLDATKRIEALRDIQDEIRKDTLQWELIELEFKKRAAHVEQELQNRLDASKERILDTVLFDLSKSNDTKVWWEQDFPFRLRQHFTGLAREAEHFVLSALGQDMQWLQQRLQKNFHTTFNNMPTPVGASGNISLAQTEVALTNIRRIRLFSRIGSGAATVMGYLLLGPIGSAISIAGGIITDQALSKQVKQQQLLLETEVRISVERSIQEYYVRVSERLEELYAHILHDLQQQQTTWEESKAHLLQHSTRVDEEQQWRRVIENSSTLSQEIKAKLTDD